MRKYNAVEEFATKSEAVKWQIKRRKMGFHTKLVKKSSRMWKKPWFLYFTPK